MDRLGIITPSHQDIITASLQQEMMQHMQHAMVPVWEREKDANMFREEFSFTSSVHFRGTFGQNEREKSSTFANYHPVEFSKKKEGKKDRKHEHR